MDNELRIGNSLVDKDIVSAISNMLKRLTHYTEPHPINLLTQRVYRYPKLGGDPEFFIVDKTDNTPIPASMVLQHDKRSKTPAFYDGLCAEINFEASTCRQGIGENIKNSMYRLIDRLKEINRQDSSSIREGQKLNLDLSFSPTIKFTEEMFSKLEDSQKEFGCDPCVNIYGADRLYLDGSTTLDRFGGGHIHMSIVNTNNRPAKTILHTRVYELIYLMDLIVGLPLVILSSEPEKEAARRKMYGKAGDFRFQEWGVEYRTPSCSYYRHPSLVSLIFGLTKGVVKLVGASPIKDLRKFVKDLHKVVSPNILQDIINNCDKKTALLLWCNVYPLIYNLTYISLVYHNTLATVSSIPFKFLFLALTNKTLEPNYYETGYHWYGWEDSRWNTCIFDPNYLNLLTTFQKDIQKLYDSISGTSLAVTSSKVSTAYAKQ